MEEEILYQTLQLHLSSSDAAQRQAWAEEIVDSEIDLEGLSSLLFEGKKVAMRYSWLLSDIGMESSEKLLAHLPYLFEHRAATQLPNFEQQLVKYWRIAGIPEEQKGTAIDLIFQWLINPKTSTHIKTVSLDVMQEVVKEYPELQNELKLCLEQQPEEMPVSLKKAVKRTFT